jgi:hypothetical protein
MIDEFSGHMHDMLHPLVNQPGEKWEYGVSHIISLSYIGNWFGLVLNFKRSMLTGQASWLNALPGCP